MTNRPGLFGALSVLACFSLLACSSDDEGKKDSGAPDVAPRADVAPETARADTALPADQVPVVPDARDTLPPPADTTPVPLDAARDEREAGGTPVDATIVDGASPVDSNLALDGGAAIDAARSSVPRIVDPQIPQADAEALAADNAAFAFAAYQKIVASADNVVFSPASISIALAMTYAGAAGTTATEMAQALHFDLPPDRLHPAFNALDQALAARGEGKLGADDGP
ncbi:MAG: hypothetical protein JXP73_18175, partial [Deltaproteobacteria bacterium]|nr:hypothetical protein [Deltaproteobacteria bacterium]